MHPLYRQALRYLDYVTVDDISIEHKLLEQWRDFQDFSFNTRTHIVDKMVELKSQGADSSLDGTITNALNFLDDVPADRDVIRQALYERWPEVEQTAENTLELVIAETHKVMKEKEDSHFEAPFRRALRHLGGIEIRSDAIMAALRTRWPEFGTLDDSTGSLLVMKLRKVLEAGLADPDWIFAWGKRRLRSESAKQAADWVCRSMQSKHRRVWLLACSYYKPRGWTGLAPLVWEIGIVDFKTGELVLSTKVDYGSASPAELYEDLYGKEPVVTSNRFVAFQDAFERHYDAKETHGKLPVMIEYILRRKGYNPKTHQLVSYNDDFAIMAVAKLLMRDDRISTSRFELDMLNRELFQPVSVRDLIKEMCVPNESDDIGHVCAKMFPGEHHNEITTAESNVKALWKVCSKLYQVLTLCDM